MLKLILISLVLVLSGCGETDTEFTKYVEEEVPTPVTDNQWKICVDSCSELGGLDEMSVYWDGLECTCNDLSVIFIDIPRTGLEATPPIED